MFVLLVLLACRGCEEAAPPPAFEAADHFNAALDARDAVASGALGALPELGRGIDASLPEELPPDARAALDRLHSAAGFLVVAEDLEEGADAVGEIGAACGACHRAMKHPMEAEKLKEGLAKAGSHAEAAELAWAALVADDGEAFARAMSQLDAAFPEEGAALPDGAAPPAARYAAALSRCAPCHQRQGVQITGRPGSP